MKQIQSRIFTVVLLLWGCVACIAPNQWQPVAGGEDITKDSTWMCVGWASVADGSVIISTDDDFQAFVNIYGPRVYAEGDFSVIATLSADSDNLAAFSLVGKLGIGNWWNETNKIDIGLEKGNVVINFYDGNNFMPRVSKSFPIKDQSDQTILELRRVGPTLIIYANNREVGQLDDPGILPDGWAYFGASLRPNNSLHLHKLAITAPENATNVQVLSSSADSMYTPTDPSLRDLADAQNLQIGGAVEPSHIRCDPTYTEVLGYEFNALVTENAFKFWPIHPEPDRFDFSGADTIVEFAEAHDMFVRGHTLVWHQSVPDWVNNATMREAEWESMLQHHITTIVSRYKGCIDAWDVVNEAIDEGGGRNLRQTVWSEGIGPDYVDKAFIWAHQADPDALLFYNDYNAEGIGTKSDRVYDLVSGMLERDIPIHGVGLQMHFQVGASPTPDDILKNMQRLGDLGLQVHITELDLRLPRDASKTLLASQANLYREMLEICLAVENCTAFVMWGFTDRYSWIPDSFPSFDHALIFDKQYGPKPAYFALREALSPPQSLGPEDFGASCNCRP